jgi:hypothetical protein
MPKGRVLRKGMYILQNWLMHGTATDSIQVPLIEKIPGIDLLYQEDND